MLADRKPRRASHSTPLEWLLFAPLDECDPHDPLCRDFVEHAGYRREIFLIMGKCTNYFAREIRHYCVSYKKHFRQNPCSLTNSEIYLTVMGFDHMCATPRRGLSSGRSVISVARVSAWNLSHLPLVPSSRPALWPVRDNRDVILSVL